MKKNLKRFGFYSAVASMLTLSLGFSSITKSEEKEVTPVAELPTEQVKLDTTVLDKLVAEEEKVEQHTQQDVSIATHIYQVSSSFLNVRDDSNADANEIDVLVQDWIVTGEPITGSSWIKLDDGESAGYINGKYVNELSPEVGVPLLEEQGTKEKPKPVFEQPKPEPVQQVSENTQQVNNEAVSVNSQQPEPQGPLQTGVTVKSNASLGQLQSLLAGTNLEGIESALLEVEQNFGVNAFFTLAVAKLESGNGKSKLATDKNNLFGMNAVDSNPYHAAFSYPSKSASVNDFGKRIKKGYIDQGLTTLASINNKYSSSSEWSVQVESIMETDLARIKN